MIYLKICCYILAVISSTIFISISSYAQIRCGSMERLNFEMQIDRSIENKRTQLEKKIERWKKKPKLATTFTIPVVFHVLYENEAENISKEQILTQLEVLNHDFNRTNSDANQTPNEFLNIAANCGITFCLAQRTVDNDSTSGITYTQTDVTSFSLYDNRIFYDSLGGKTIWDSNKFLNIYVCDLSNALGFASFPGSTESRDAVVIDFEHFGTINVSPPYNMGRTATHEVGHWLNLLHIWGDGNCGSDQVEDTPVQETENYNCPSHPSPSCGNNGDMFQNFMDYTDDACMNLFTIGQKDRMHATLNIDRSEATNGIYCEPPYEDIGINEAISPQENQEFCGEELIITTSLFNYSSNPIYNASIHYSIDGQPAQSIDWNGNLEPNSSVEVNLDNLTLNPGQHSLSIYSSNPNGFRDLNPFNDTTHIQFLIKSGTNYDIIIQTDNYAEENYWHIENSIGQIVSSGNNFISNEINTLNYCQDLDSCHTLIIFDDYSDGICCDFGNGYIQVNEQVFSGSFGSQIEIDLCSISTSNNFESFNNFSLYPNPTNGKVTLESTQEPIKKIEIYDTFGKIVLLKGCHSKKEQLNLYELANGIYLLKIQTATKIQTFKFFKQ